MNMHFDQYFVTFKFDDTKAIGYHYDRKIPYVDDDGNIAYRSKSICSNKKIDDYYTKSQEDIQSDIVISDSEYAISGNAIRSIIQKALRVEKRENPNTILSSIDRSTIDRHILTGEFIEIDARKVFDHDDNHTISIDEDTKKYKDTVYKIYPKSCTFVLCNVCLDQEDRGIDMSTIKALLDSVVEHNICNITNYTIRRNTDDID